MAEQKDAKKAVLYSSAPPDDIQKERLEKFIKYKFGTGFELTYIKDKNLDTGEITQFKIEIPNSLKSENNNKRKIYYI